MTTLKKRDYNYLWVFVIGLITSFAFFLPFLIQDKGIFLYYGDYNAQQIPFYTMCHDMIRNGSIGWNWYTDLGVNFIGSYTFYLFGSPMFWMTIPFPREAVPYLMTPLLMLKFAFTGVTSYAYIKRFTKTPNMAVVGALMYAFCGFNIYNIFFNHFNEVVMLFPLLLISLEELMINNRRGSFAIMVAVMCLVNYYFFFGQVIFVVMYFIIRSTSKDFGFTWKKFFTAALEAVIGLFMSAVLLLPSIAALLGNTRLSKSMLGYDLFAYYNSQMYLEILASFFFPPDIPARPNFFPLSDIKWSSISAFLPIFSMTGVLAFMKGAKKSWIKKLLGICAVFCLVPFLNQSFNFLNNTYYARWYYMPLLIAVVATCIALEDYVKEFKFSIPVVGGFIVFFTLVGVMPYRKDGKLIFFDMPNYKSRFWIYVIISVMSLALTVLLLVLIKKNAKHFNRFAVPAICLMTVFMATYMISCGHELGEGYEKVITYGVNGRETLELPDDEFYRIDTYECTENLPMLMKMPGINAFHSIVPPSVTEYYSLIGYSRGVGSRPDESFAGLRALTSVKYRFVRHEEEKKESSESVSDSSLSSESSSSSSESSSASSKKEEEEKFNQLGFSYYDTQNGYDIYENDYFVPMGFTYDKLLSRDKFLDSENKKRDRIFLHGLFLTEKGYQEYSKYFETVDTPKNYSELTTDTQYKEACKNLKENAVDSFSYDKDGFSSTITVDKPSMLFFSVPYDDGFTAFVNGQQVEITKANGGFMMIPVGQGFNEIRFNYKTPWLSEGIRISLISVVLLAVYYWLCIRVRANAPDDERYLKNAHRVAERNVPVSSVKEQYIASITDIPEEEELTSEDEASEAETETDASETEE